MHDARRQEDAVARLRHEAVQALGHATLGQVAFQVMARDSGLEAGVNAGRGVRGQHDPGFGLAHLAGQQRAGDRVVGMHLHGELLAAVQKFDQQRKLRRRLAVRPV